MPTATPFNNLITFSRGSNATVTGSNGLIQWAPNNLLTFSEQFDNANWPKQDVTVTANIATAPDGSITADLMYPTTTGISRRILRSTSLIAGNVYTQSLYVKAAGKRWVYLNGIDASSAANDCWFDVQNGVVGTKGASVLNAVITAVGDGWYRLSTTGLVGVNNFFYLMAVDNNGSYTSTTNGTDGILIWGAQLELGSTATTYNPTTVKNLLGFSEAFDNAAWTKSNASIVTGAQANPVNGLFNAQKLMENTANTAHRVQQTININGAPITLSAYIKAGERTWAYLRIDDASSTKFAYFNLVTGAAGSTSSGVTSSITSVGSGWYRCSITFAAPTPTASGAAVVASTTADATSSNLGDGNSGVYIYGAQLSDSASLDPYVPTPGAAPSSTAFYGPRFDFDPVTRAPRGILIEEPRTNSLTYSNTFSDASWTAIGTKNLVANSTVSPDGEVNASTLTDNSAAAFQGMGKTVTVANDNATYTASIYVRKTTGGTSATFGFNFQLTGGTVVGISPRLNTDTGALLSGSGTVQNAGAYWRLSATITNNTTGNTSLGLSVYAATAAYNSGIDSVAATGSAIIYGAQLEAGAFATSYIPTIASTVTRSADVALISGQNFGQWYNQSAGSFVVNASSLTLLDVGYILTTSDGTNNNRFGFYRSSANIAGYITNSGVVQMEIAAGSVVANAPFKTAAAATANDGNFSLNGSIAAADTSITMPTLNKVDIANINSSGFFSGHIRTINFIPARAADFQLQALTAQSIVDYFYLQTAAGDQLVAGNDDYLYSLPILG